MYRCICACLDMYVKDVQYIDLKKAHKKIDPKCIVENIMNAQSEQIGYVLGIVQSINDGSETSVRVDKEMETEVYLSSFHISLSD